MPSRTDIIGPDLRAQISDDDLINEALRDYAEAGGRMEQTEGLEPDAGLYEAFIELLDEQILQYDAA